MKFYYKVSGAQGEETGYIEAADQSQAFKTLEQKKLDIND